MLPILQGCIPCPQPPSTAWIWLASPYDHQHTRRVALQVQLALLDVVWGLDELALPGCAASLGDLVCDQGLKLLFAGQETGWDAMGRQLPCYRTSQPHVLPAYHLAEILHLQSTDVNPVQIRHDT